jgi:hypothetical protein
MFPRIQSVKPLEHYTVELTFTDGLCAPGDLSKWIVGHGGVFAPLQEVSYFRRVEVDPEAKTIFWPNGVDFCPDMLYAEATITIIPQGVR